MTEDEIRPSEGPRTWKSLLAGFAVLYGVLVAVYWPAVGGKLLWNDADYVTKLSLRPASGLVRIWTDPGATEQYYPLLHTAFWFEHRIWGDSAIGYHLMTLGLHA